MALPMAVYFHRITVFALPVNVFILPLLVVLMPAALMTLLLALIFASVRSTSGDVGRPAAAFRRLAGARLRVAGSWDFRIPAPLLWQSAAFCLLLTVSVVLARLALSSGSGWQRRLAWAALLLAALAAVTPRPVQHPRDALLVEAIDVGQGDSLLLITPDGRLCLSIAAALAAARARLRRSSTLAKR